MLKQEVHLSLSDGVFWHHSHERDLLLVLAKRWLGFPSDLQTRIADRLLEGPSKLKEEGDQEYVGRRAASSLNRIHWLGLQGCKFPFDIEFEVSKLRELAPRWKEEHGENAAASIEPIAGFVRSDTSYEPLLNISLSDVLSTAAQLTGRRELLIEDDPFAGLASTRPVRALSALRVATKGGDCQEWAWKTFLNSDSRTSDKPEGLVGLIAARIARLPPDLLPLLAYAVSEWMLRVKWRLFWDCLERSLKQCGRSFSALETGVDTEPSSYTVDDKKTGVGARGTKCTRRQACADAHASPQRREPGCGHGFSPWWRQHVEQLLSLPDNSRLHALTIFSYYLDWFYVLNPDWTETHLLVALEGERNDQAALWAGLLWGEKPPPDGLYLRLKPHLLKLAKSNSEFKRGHTEVLAGLILDGWRASRMHRMEPPLVTDAEARDVLLNVDEDFRLSFLWTLEKWSGSDEHSSKETAAFLRQVWPRQVQAKSPKVSAKLAELALSNVAYFPEIVEVSLPLLTTADGEYLFLYDVTDKEGLVAKHPEHALALLHAVLPTDTSKWPSDIAKILDSIDASNTLLRKDVRLVELRRRWNAR